MPLYEYVCGSCAERFEQLVRSASTTQVACPRCGSANVQKAVSTFASFGSGTDSLPMAASGGCCGGAGGCACSR
jgi:putative FmdB family regulatory protein